MKPKPFNVTVRVNVFPSDTLFMRHAVGTAERDGQAWEMSCNVAGMVPIVRLPDGQWVTFPWQHLIDAANEAGNRTRTSGARAEARRPPRKGGAA